MYKAVIFDLDGTLLNTLEDLALASNYALEKLGFPTHEMSNFRYFVGSGRRQLIERMLPNDKKTINNIDLAAVYFDEYYSSHKEDNTSPYEGIIELLDKLIMKDIKIAVVSNKPHEFIEEVLKTYFGDRISIAIGHRKGYLEKPDPTTVNEVIKTLNLNKLEVLYVGDSDIDMLTANNAGIDSCGVLWGFRDYDELVENGAKFIVSNTDELEKIICN
jgi:phosphoglycolate phosphatase